MAAARFYSSTAGAINLTSSPSSGDTSITVSTTTGLPGTRPFTLVLDPGAATEEIVTVTNVSGLTLTITRGVDGSAAQAHSAGVANVRHMATARDYREPQEHIGASAAVHGLAGTVVGTTDVQTLTNKTAQAASAATIGLLVKGAASQTASILEAQDSAGSPVFQVSAIGISTGDTGVAINTDEGANLFGKVAQFVAAAAAVVPLILKAAASQTADLLQLKNSAGTTIAKFDSAGNLTAPAVTSTGAVSGVAGTFSGQVQSNGVNVVTLTETQTLTNKSLTAPALTGTATAATIAATVAVTAPNLPASSTTKAGKRLHWGTVTQSTGASGLMTVTHGAGFTPTSVIITPSNIGYQFKVDAVGATTFQLQWLVDNSTAAPTSTSMVFFYFCGE